ncbi:cytochrome P450 [Lactifluus volemus]|nr:cytochrome P450 [Lactifluus volemus]
MPDDFTSTALFLGGILILVYLFLSWYRRDPLTRPGLFKIAHFRRWVVLAAGPELAEDIRKAPDNVLDMRAPVYDDLQPEYTLMLLNLADSYHTDIIRSKLTRNIAATFGEVREELVLAFDDLIQTRDDEVVEWIKVPIVETMQRVICAVSNRVFVGAPLCRNRDYQTLNLTYAINVVKFGTILSMFPKSLRPIVSRMLSDLPSQIRQETEFIRPMVEERFAKLKELTLTQVLYRLLSHPECIQPLREEVEAVVAEEGWTKAAMDKMFKIDSFIRETQRLDGINFILVTRLVLRPFTFSNGVTVPPGVLVAVPSGVAHRDEEVYTNADKFEGLRFSKLRERDGDSHLVLMMALSPGRFFAATELKALLAHMIVTYDMKFEEGKGAPPQLWIAGVYIPRSANVMFRKRQA